MHYRLQSSLNLNMDKFIVRVPNRGLRNGKNKSKNTKIEAVIVQECEKESKTQLYIDLGQKTFGKTKICLFCGMLFVVGDVSDERKHESYCRTSREAPTLNSWKGLERIAFDVNENDSIFKVNSTIGSFPSFIDDVIVLMRQDLGLSTDFEPNEPQLVIFIFCRGKVIIGCVMVEEVSSAQIALRQSSNKRIISHEKENFTLASKEVKRMHSNLPSSISGDSATVSDDAKNYSDSSLKQSNRQYKRFKAASSALPEVNSAAAAEGNAVTNDEAEATEIEAAFTKGAAANIVTISPQRVAREYLSNTLLGIRAMWVHYKYRKQRVASSLLDAARQHVCFGVVIPRTSIAICDPTSDGAAFIRKYMSINSESSGDHNQPLLLYSPT